jgi:hypothetical protein
MKRKMGSISTMLDDGENKLKKSLKSVNDCSCNFNKINRKDVKKELDIKSDCVNENTSYRLWRLGQIKEKNKLSRDIKEDLKILVRSKQDGYEVNIMKSYALIYFLHINLI